MGCSSTREKIEDIMMVYKLQRMEIQMEKEKELKKLAEIEGRPIERSIVPDYIDPEFAKERKLNEKEQDENKSKKKKNKIESPKKRKEKEKN